MHEEFKSLRKFDAGKGREGFLYSLPALEEQGIGNISRLPVSIRIVLESVLRNCDGKKVRRKDVETLANWNAKAPANAEIPFVVARIVLKYFTGVPLIVDLAEMRSAVARLGRDPKIIEPLVPVDLVVDHSVQVDFFGPARSLELILELEFKRNRERYQFLKWGQQAFKTFQLVPPGIGIVHQVNLEYLAKGVLSTPVTGVGDAGSAVSDRGHNIFYPDTLVGTDSHTTMINGLGVVGWGVGGIEAEAGMLGQPVYFLTPEVVGVHMRGKLREGVTATDLVLHITQLLRAHKVVGKFVEFYGEGAASLPVPDRATIGNMSPEYGATIGYFPVDQESVYYLRATGRSDEQCAAFENYFRAQHMFGMPRKGEIDYSVDLNLELGHGSVLIAAITSCTNTSNPSVMLAAGLLAKKAVERGMRVDPAVKTSLAPGSRVVSDYLTKTGLQLYLDQLGFNLVGYGCTTCIGNSGPLHPKIEKAIHDYDLVAASVLSGNRNFEARVHQNIKANFLMSPPLVVAFALAGRVDLDLTKEPIGKDKSGKDTFLRDLWPSLNEVRDAMHTALTT